MGLTCVWFGDRKVGDTLVRAHEEIDWVKSTIQESLLCLVDLYQAIGTLEKMGEARIFTPPNEFIITIELLDKTTTSFSRVPWAASQQPPARYHTG